MLLRAALRRGARASRARARDCAATPRALSTGGDTSGEASRVERDSMGEVAVPSWALWGASTQRAADNFRVSGVRMPRRVLAALGDIKARAACCVLLPKERPGSAASLARSQAAAARANAELGVLPRSLARAVAAAAERVASGELDEHFPLDVFQTGSGTSTNMNANEARVQLGAALRRPRALRRCNFSRAAGDSERCKRGAGRAAARHARAGAPEHARERGAEQQ